MMPVHACTDCHGRGGMRVEEPDEPTTWWACEGCDRSGLTTSCRECGDPMSVPEADQHDFFCIVCRSYVAESDYQAALESLRGMG